MSTVLVVDDSAVDRRLVGGLLEKDANMTVRYAVDGSDALEKIEQEPPDLVVTDLIMPEIDGLTLVSSVRDRFRLVPTILMTSKGSEELAVQALEQGAASYVPKDLLSRRLLDTVRNVLVASTRQRGYSRLMGCMTSSESHFELENDSSLIGPLVTYLQEDCSHMRICDDADRIRVGVALEEALANAVYHGNLEVSSDLRESDDDRYWKLIQERRVKLPFGGRRVRVSSNVSRDEARFVISDDGQGFDPYQLPDPTDPANLEKVSGRGILLMRTFMDDVIYNEKGNAVTLVKRGESETNSNGNGRG